MFVITFKSTHDALKAEKILKKANYKLEIIPTPKEISAECGFTILLKSEIINLDELEEKLDRIDFNYYDYKTFEKLS